MYCILPSYEPRRTAKGLTETSILMSITNAMGWAIIDWSIPRANVIFVMFTVTIAIGYLVIWFYWKGRNWARILVILTSLLSLYNLRHWNHSGIVERVMNGGGAVLGIFLLYSLNAPSVRSLFWVPSPPSRHELCQRSRPNQES